MTEYGLRKFWRKIFQVRKFFLQKDDSDYGVIAKSTLFDKKWYLEQNPDVKSAGIDPVRHYLDCGWRENRNCTPYFDGRLYLELYPDVAAADMNPFLHWEKFGKKENRYSGMVEHHKTTIIKKKHKYNCGVIYTCITGNYDNLIQHTYQDLNWDYVCFTDNECLLQQQKVGVWTIKKLQFDTLDNVRNARWHKVHPHVLFPDYKYSIWIDGNIDVLTKALFRKADIFLKSKDVVFSYKHPERDCVYDEVETVLLLHKDYPEIIKKEAEFLKEENYPSHHGLSETSILIRKHNQTSQISFANLWWHLIQNYSRRDQLGFDYSLWKNNLSISQAVQKNETIVQGKNYIRIPCLNHFGATVQFNNVSTISVIIPVYNALDDVKKLFNSIVKANFSDRIDILVINDASGSETTEFLREWSLKNPKFKLMENKENLGFIKTCNRGMKQATGDVVVLLNSDTVIPQSLERKIIYCFNKNTYAGIASPIASDSGLWSIPLPENMSVDEMDKLVENISEKSYPNILCPEGFCFCVRRQVLDTVGYLDEIYGRGYCEETDLAFRALNNGWALILIDDLYVYHKRHTSFGIEMRQKQIEKNSAILWQRWRGLYDKYNRRINMPQLVKNISQNILTHIDSPAKS